MSKLGCLQINITGKEEITHQKKIEKNNLKVALNVL